MSLPDWLHYLESLPSGLTNKSLESVKNIAKNLAVLNFSGKVITVAGTNGKGSTVIFLEAILLAAGLKTGAYISPHLLNYNERIRLNGKDIDDKTLCQAFSLVKKASVGTELSYFEFSTLAALVIFKEQNIDILILETGLGGRFDAVNILDSDISIITTIAFDHIHILGNTKEVIGYEKSGIIRSLCPVICGENMPETVYATARKLQAKSYCLHGDFSYIEKNNCWDWCFGKTRIENLPLPNLPITNASLALMAIQLLSQDFEITVPAIIIGLKNAFLAGRFQQLTFNGKEVILDVAHNFEAATLLALNLTRKKGTGRTLAVLSMLKDKDIIACLSPLIKVIDWWYLGVLSEERAASGSQLSQSLQQNGATNFVLLPTVQASFKQAIAECQEKDRIVVFGSFHTVAECLNIIDKKVGE